MSWLAAVDSGHANGMSDDQHPNADLPDQPIDKIEQQMEDAEGGVEASLLDAPEEPDVAPT
ncbi:MAG: hypothetical protein JWM12_3380 [Ilumatobacteraceae bacterium]|nr:hypothetical protein [Ilumatobacteraceae bacterium]